MSSSFEHLDTDVVTFRSDELCKQVFIHQNEILPRLRIVYGDCLKLVSKNKQKTKFEVVCEHGGDKQKKGNPTFEKPSKKIGCKFHLYYTSKSDGTIHLSDSLKAQFMPEHNNHVVHLPSETEVSRNDIKDLLVDIKNVAINCYKTSIEQEQFIKSIKFLFIRCTQSVTHRCTHRVSHTECHTQMYIECHTQMYTLRVSHAHTVQQCNTHTHIQIHF
jgi:hypothetical protein